MENHLTIAVCDDIAADRAELYNLTEKILRDCGISHKIIEYPDGKGLLNDMDANTAHTAPCARKNSPTLPLE